MTANNFPLFPDRYRIKRGTLLRALIITFLIIFEIFNYSSTIGYTAHPLGTSVVTRETLLKVTPIFVAILVWLIRVLIIGTFWSDGKRRLTQNDIRGKTASEIPGTGRRRSNYRPAPAKGAPPAKPTRRSRPEPTYEPVTAHRRST